VLLASRPHPPGTNAFLIHFVDVLSALSIPGALLSVPVWLLFPRVYDVSSGSVAVAAALNVVAYSGVAFVIVWVRGDTRANRIPDE